MPLEIQQDVIQLQIPVDDSLLVQKDQSGPYLGGVELGALFRESAALLYVEHEVAAVQVLHHEEQMRLSLEGAEQVAEVRMTRGQGEDFALDQGALDVVVLENHVLLQAFHGVDALGATELRQEDFAETALAQNL